MAATPPGSRRGGALGTLFRYELKMLLRDRRMLFFSVLLPLLVLPALIFLMRFTEERAEARRETRTYEYAVVGEAADLARALIADALALPPDSAPEDDGPARVGGGAFIEAAPADPDSALLAGEIQFVVRAFSAGQAAARRDSTRRARAEAAEEANEQAEGRGIEPEDLEEVLPDVARASSPAVPLLELRYRGDSDRSDAGARRMRDRLADLREHRRSQAYRSAGLPVDPTAVAAVELDRTASAERETGAQLALWLTPLLVMLLLSGGSVVAADTISGEKERGTIETLLTTAARRREIVLAKQLLIIVVGIGITLINVANLALYLGLGLFELPERFVISVGPTSLILLLLLFLPLTVLISSVLLIMSGYAKSYKEYQLYLFPVMLPFVLGSSAAVLPGLELASVVAFLPLVNISVAVREVLVGEYDWLFLAITVLTTSLLAGWLARLTERSLSTEKLITAAETDEADLRGGPELFPRRVLRWFAVMWAIFFILSAWLGGALGIRAQVTINLVVLFLGASLLMIRRYRLDPGRALALRAPSPAVWPAVLIGAPSAFIVGIGLAQLGQLVFPIPEELLEAFGQFLLPEGIPLWQVVFFLAVLPGICEEIAFRGVLLHGLRGRLQPVPLALAVGAIFGFFHVELFRLIPTAYLGVVLAAVTLLTGSIFPAMLWHALNNAVALVPAYLGWWSPDATVPWWAYPTAAGGLAAAFGILWAVRSPYPELKGRAPRQRPDARARSSHAA